MQQTSSHSSADTPALRRTSFPGNVVRGGLIGIVETVPGVSGGTVALVVGIYRQLIDSASAIVSAFRCLVTGPDRKAGFRQNMAAVYWGVVIPVMIGMPIGILGAAALLGDLIESQPELTRAVFFGMVAASLAVPFRMATPLKAKHWGAGVAAAALTFLLVSLPPQHAEPAWWIILPAAAVAVSALLLPGLSGSFLLLTVGLYEPTIQAVNDRDVGYLGIFLIGLLVGVVSIVKALKWLLDHHTTMTLAVLTGVMLGALRALWPWQTEERALLAPTENLGPVLGLAAAGFIVVAVLVAIDARAARQPATQ